MNEFKVNLNEAFDASLLKAGDKVLLSGTIYTARDAAHRRMKELLLSNECLPFEIKGACIYYTGPTETPDSMSIGSCGPTTSSRMDAFTPLLLDNGLKFIIGKGDRNNSVYEALGRNSAIYFCAIGGAGALYSKHVVINDEIAFKDLGCESIKKLVVKDFPVYVAIDIFGNSIYKKNK